VEEQEKALQITKHFQTTGDEKYRWADDPLILTQLAIALNKKEQRKALDFAIHALSKMNATNFVRLINPAMVHYLVAKLANRNNIHATALQSIRNALEIWPDEPRWCALAADILGSEDETVGLPNLSDALYYLEKAVDLEPDNWKIAVDLGKMYLYSGNHSQASLIFKNVTELAPEESEPWMLLAESQSLSKDYKQALQSVEKALEYSEDPIEPLLMRGEIELQMNKPKDAQKFASSVLSLQPNHPAALHLLARALNQLDKPSEALEVIDKALPKLGESLPLEIERVLLIRNSQGLEAAIIAGEKLAQKYPNQPYLLAVQSKMMIESGDLEKANQLAQKAIQENEDDLSMADLAELYFMIGRYMHESGQLDQAILHLNHAVQRAPNYFEAFLELGNVYQKRRQSAHALKVYHKAIEISPEDYRPYYQAGVLLKENKEYEDAEKMLQKAVKLAPRKIQIQRLLGAIVAINLVNNRQLQSMEP
jgi:tetratricopeptide (TPR) repeat protein